MSEDTLIPASQLAELRAHTARALPHTAHIFTPTRTRGPGGVTTVGYAPPAATTLPCRLVAVRASDRVQAEQPVSVREWTLVFAVAPDVALTLADRIVISGTTDGVAWTETVRLLAEPGEHSVRVSTRCRVTDSDVTPIALA